MTAVIQLSKRSGVAVSALRDGAKFVPELIIDLWSNGKRGGSLSRLRLNEEAARSLLKGLQAEVEKF